MAKGDKDQNNNLAEENKNLKIEITLLQGAYSQLKRVTTELGENEAKLKESQKIGRFGRWEFDVLSKKITWSDETYILYERDKSLGPPSFEEEAKYYSPEESKRLHEMAKTAISEGKEFENYDITANLPSGRTVFFNAVMYSVKDTKGNVTKLFGIVQDITERRKAEESVELFKNAIESSSDAIGMSTPEGKHYYQNKAFSEMFGDIGNDPPGSVYVDEKVGREVFRAIMSGNEWIGEIEMYGKGKKILNILLRAYSVKDNNGKIMGLVGAHTDITERKKMGEELEQKTFELQSKVKELSESQLILQSLAEDIQKEKEGVEIKVEERTREVKEEQARLTASINSLTIGFVLCDLNDKVILKNQAVSRILEIPEREITIDGIKKYFKGSVDLEMYHSQCIKEKKPVEIKNIDMGKKFLRLLLAPVIMIRDSEEIIGHILLIEDITEAKVIERSREEFFTVASHELRTPLTAIRGNVSLIQDFYADKIKDKEVMAMISDIHEASVRLIKIVYDFLDVSALEQRKIEFKKEQFDIASLIETTINEMKEIVSQKNLYIKFEIPKQPLPRVVADHDRTKQIIMNLISNAINYTKKGGVTVKIEPQGKYLKMYVADTGIGILPENQTLLFREFQQAGEKILTRDITKGTGLGLYISKLLVEGMGGTIGLVKSEPAIGSTFALTLPTAP